MAVAQEQGEKWGTQNIPLEGGLFLDKDVLWQAAQMPGSAIQLTNLEPSLDGGYHRLLGYQPYDANQIGGTSGQVFGVIVNPFEDTVTAFKAGNTYQSTGSGWNRINGADVHSSMGVIQFTKYSWSTSRFTFVDGDPAAHPVRIEAAGAYTILTNAPTGQKFIQEFSGYLWMTSGDGNLTFSAPNDDTNYNAIAGAGELNVGFDIVGLGIWRGALYVFGTHRIAQVTGTSAVDWIVTTLTDELGMVGMYSLQEVNGDLVFLSSDGLRTISGTARVFDRELGVISRPISTLIIPMGGNNISSCVIKTKSQYRLFQGTSSTEPTTAPGVIGTLRLQSNGSVSWEWSTISGISASCADSGLFNGGELVIHGAWDGYVYKQESGTDFNGEPIQAVYQTPHLVYNDPNIRKILQKLCANFRCSGSNTVNVGIIYDYGDGTAVSPPDQMLEIGGGSALWDSGFDWSDSNTVFWGSSPDTRACCYLIGSGFTASFIFHSSGGADYSLQAYTTQYGQGARR